jgi:rhamnogalacturonyl hydrolase YesR
VQKGLILVAIPAIALSMADLPAGAEPPLPDPPSVLQTMKKVADWQLVQPPKHNTDDWTFGALYAGMTALIGVADDAKYHDAMVAMGEQHGWKPAKRVYHADDHCVSQTYLDLYMMHRDPKMLAPTKERFDYILDHQATNALVFKQRGSQDRWSWCDALFMGPPAWTRLAAATGERKYLEFMNREWWATSEHLYDGDEHLYYRDDRYIGQREANGRKIFWSRGNGWVFAGLARVLQVLPPDFPDRGKYVQQYREMADAIAAAQQSDGLWRASLLDPESYPLKETSGSGFYCFGLAWGINRGLLDPAKFTPAALKAWEGLVSCVGPDGKLKHVQPVGADPKAFDPEHSDVYGVGAFLLAGSEVYRMALGGADGFAYGAFVPQRMDDFAWENDRIAFRVYGLALRRTEPQTGSGIDVWLKRTRKPVIEKWYFLADYHKDHGEGLDMYKVGPGRGCGGSGVWREGKLYVPRTFVTWRMVENGPKRVAFELGYEPWDAAGLQVRETKRIALEAGSNLNRIESRLEWEGGPDELDVGVGIVTRPGGGEVTVGPDGSWASYWEPADPENGTTGCGIVMTSPARREEAEGHVLLVTRVRRGAPLVYLAGAGWTKSGDFADRAAWEAYVGSRSGEAAALRRTGWFPEVSSARVSD